MSDLAQRLAEMQTPRTNDAVWETEDSHEDVVYAAEARALERENGLLREALKACVDGVYVLEHSAAAAGNARAVLALLEGK